MVRWILFVFVLGGCVTPPVRVESRVFSPDEVTLVSFLKEGEDYIRSGRADLAEVKFRKALEISPTSSNVLNNLGFSLLEQNRREESIKYFIRALKADANNKSAFKNLIRTYYQMGNYQKAIYGYKALLEVLPLNKFLNTLEINKIPNLSVLDIVSVYRDLASLYYVIGEVDEALCYSNMAVTLLGNREQLLIHERMLLSLNKYKEALPYLKIIISQNNKLDSESLIDYVAVLYLNGDSLLAKQVVDRLLSDVNISDSKRNLALILKILLLRDSGISEEEFFTVSNSVTEENKDFCVNILKDVPDYWPESLLIYINNSYLKICEGKVE